MDCSQKFIVTSNLALDIESTHEKEAIKAQVIKQNPF